MTIVLDVVSAFPGRRVVPGDVFVIDLNDSDVPVSELRYHGPDHLPWVASHLPLMRCRAPRCCRCPFAGSCPLQPAPPARERRRLRLIS